MGILSGVYNKMLWRIVKNMEFFIDVDWAQFSLGIDINIEFCYICILLGPISFIVQWDS